ncbi:hypothetical protein [Thermocatellispora tengchongensis]|uniref:hypothetical protein n=1 Tax=Thermocatellispora tengchongensis TaxID=1073253 RepID=UPI00362A8DEE
MPEIRPLREGDPGEVGSYRLLGRLGESTYLGRSPGGERVVIKLLPADADRERFMRVIEPLQGPRRSAPRRSWAPGLWTAGRTS